MDMDPQILIELTKIISEQNENPIRIEKNLVQKNPPKDKTRSYNVQLGSSTLILSKTNNSQCSEAKHQKFLDQLDQIERQKKLYYQILETEESLTSSKYGISVRGGDLGKSGPGPRAKADALKNARKTGGGSIFAQSFTPQRQYCSRPINKPLSCRTTGKLNEQQFNGNQNTAKQTNQDCTLTREQRRNLPHPDDVRIPDQDVIIRHGQAKYKVKNHGSDFSLPSKPNEKGWLKTPRTSESIEGFKDEIKKLVLRGERIEGTYRKGEPDQFSAIHFYDSVSGCNAIFKQETKEFVSAWKLTQGQVSDLLTNKNIGDY
jgi:hypothetical protein